MEIEQMEMEEIETDNKLDQPINKKKSQKKSKNKSSFSKKLATFTLFSITLISFFLFIYYNKRAIYNLNSLEKNEKAEGSKILGESPCKPEMPNQEGECITNYSFKAIYKTFKEEGKIQLINSIDLKIVKEMIIEGKKVEPTKDFKFNTKGNHEVYFLLDDSKLDSLSHLFDNIIYLESIYFS